MYTMNVPFKDFNGKPRKATVHFNLTESEVIKLLAELQGIDDWRKSISGPERDLSAEEVVAFYNNFEEILLTAYGVPSEDGMYFRKSGRYDFQESALFNACMVEFLSNPEETGRFLDQTMPKDFGEIVKKADAGLAEAAKKTDDQDLLAEIERLRAQVAQQSTQN